MLVLKLSYEPTTITWYLPNASFCDLQNRELSVFMPADVTEEVFLSSSSKAGSALLAFAES